MTVMLVISCHGIGQEALGAGAQCVALFDKLTPNKSSYAAASEIINSDPLLIAQELNRENLTLDILKNRGEVRYDGVTRPIKYTTKSGRSFLFKGERDAALEVVAYKLSRQFEKVFITPSTLYEVNGQLFAVQRWLPEAPLVKWTGGKKVVYENMAQSIKWQLPGEAVLFDLLIGNLDRRRANGHNYLIFTDGPLNQMHSNKNITVLLDHRDGFGSWNLDRIWDYGGLDINQRNSEYVAQILNSHKDFVQSLKKIDENYLMHEFGNILSPIKVKAILERRAQLLSLVIP